MNPTTISDLFDIRYGHSLELNRHKQVGSSGGVAFVSRTTRNNGVSAYVTPIPGETPAPAGDISVALGANPLATFLQDRPFYTGRDVAILRPRAAMSNAVMLYYCMCLRANRYRYSYGRQANKTLKHLRVPAVSDVPDWVSVTSIDRYAGAEKSNETSPAPSLADCRRWEKFRLGELFEIRKGKRLTKNDRVRGATPYIGALDRNNGLVEFIDREPIHRGGTITVNYNGIGGVASAFYQPGPYWCSDDVNVLYPKARISPAAALFVATVIRREKYRFSFGRKWHLERMLQSHIYLPATAEGTPDWMFMERYMNALPFSSQL